MILNNYIVTCYPPHARRALKWQSGRLHNLINRSLSDYHQRLLTTTISFVTITAYLSPSNSFSMSTVTVNMNFFIIEGDMFIDDHRQSSSYFNSFNRISTTIRNSNNVGGVNGRNEEGSGNRADNLNGECTHLT